MPKFSRNSLAPRMLRENFGMWHGFCVYSVRPQRRSRLPEVRPRRGLGTSLSEPFACLRKPAGDRRHLRFAGFDKPGLWTALALLFALAPPALLAQPPPAPDPDFLKREQATPLAPRPTISGVEHTVIHYDKNTYCGHPREVLFQDFGGGEFLLGHFHAPCRYEVYEDVRHICYQGRSIIFLQRSKDGGRTWPAENDATVFDNTMPTADKRAFLSLANAAREPLDMFRNESVFLFSRAYLPPDHVDTPVTFCLRSADKGRRWEKAPIAVADADNPGVGLYRHNTPLTRMPDGRTLLSVFHPVRVPTGANWERGTGVFSSTDQGLTWRFVSVPIEDRSRQGRFIYPTLLLLPNGDLHCYAIHLAASGEEVEGVRNALVLCVSRDAGKTWSDPAPIAGKGGGCWKNPGREGVVYRSPWPMRLRDGRILVLFARRRMPGGIGGIVSADGGKTWSEEFALRDDGQWWDLGYPVATELDDGRIFTAYYFNRQDGNKQGGTRYIAGTFFRLD